MKNTVIKGDGTSRKLKAPSSLPESFSEWRTQLLAGNATLDIALNPDGCETVGTPLSKSNLLTDETKTALGLTSNDPTVNEALNQLGNKKQDASTAITTSNIGSQTVNKAKYAYDGTTIGTAALRNQYFVSSESTPTVNGQIAWVYG